MISFVEKLLFTKHLLVMTKSGITIAEAVETIASETKSVKFRKILEDVNKNIRNGQPLAKSLGKHPKIFDQFFVSLIEIGEESGTLDTSLDYLAKQQTREYALRKKIQGALLYPAIVVTAITFVGIGMSLFVLPNLVDLFSSLDVKLPITTQILLFFAGLMKNHGIFIIAAFIASIFLFRIFVSLSFVKPIWHKFLLSLPIFGRLFQARELTLLCRNLGIMLKSGLPIRKALEVEYFACGNYVFKDYIRGIQKSVDKGKEISYELEKGNYSKFSPIAIKMIGVGEKTGQLDESFLYLSDFFDEEVDNIAKNLSVVLEPIILLVIGLMVGFVALAIISPIYELTGSIR
jgi:type II secretory pathway component PulF